MSDNAPQGQNSRLRVWFRDIVISVIASFFIVTFLYQPVRVEGTSMQPELRDQDRLFIDKFFFNFEKIDRGDIVVFHYPRDPEKSYIKRVIALPGDSIYIDHGRVWVNNQPLDEPYVPRRYRDTRSMAEMIVPAGRVLRDGRPPLHFQRQPRLWPRRSRPHLRQGRFHLLARVEYGRRALNLFQYRMGRAPAFLPVRIPLLNLPCIGVPFRYALPASSPSSQCPTDFCRYRSHRSNGMDAHSIDNQLAFPDLATRVLDEVEARSDTLEFLPPGEEPLGVFRGMVAAVAIEIGFGLLGVLGWQIWRFLH